ncbi:carboxymuconolactone decarboxylase family protein [Defluviimonas sp. SAOS-178_SWC]|uniref:carboxymuconolactone decarboxylase family protein n=1 Tax=Defluviimonas sp. SAOS-178_SWC TaxID=3121287 RepID=UPI00322148A8
MSRLLTALAFTAAALPALASEVDDARADIEKTLGGVPSFVSQIADSALPGLWQQTKALEFSSDTALDPKTKALISLGVAAQIPCNYCIWMDTNSARQAGATDQEIAEAVAVAGMTRNWSTIFNGVQVDFDQFKAELGGN